MPYITREDGERFIIPSYRDTLSAKKKSLMKREILMLSANYGDYITLQKKNDDQYEVTFAKETGYLLGECVWHYFKRPFDMIYCEAIPDTTDAILVIVKSGSVYLDGSFPVDSIADELVVFATQQNNFAIYVHGDVPISEDPEPGKFSFEKNHVRSFEVLTEPVFQTLPGIKVFQLNLVNEVLKANGIGVVPIKTIIMMLAPIVLIMAVLTYMNGHQSELPSAFTPFSNPYDEYTSATKAPDAGDVIVGFVEAMKKLMLMPGWVPNNFIYTPGVPGTLQATAISAGVGVETLLDWGNRNLVTVSIQPGGVSVKTNVFLRDRPEENTIVRIQNLIAVIIDRMVYVVPGNALEFSGIDNKKNYTAAAFDLKLASTNPDNLLIIANVFKGMPVIISGIVLTMNADNTMTGKISFTALGN